MSSEGGLLCQDFMLHLCQNDVLLCKKFGGQNIKLGHTWRILQRLVVFVAKSSNEGCMSGKESVNVGDSLT